MARISRPPLRAIAASFALLIASSPAFAASKDQFRRYLTAAERLFHNLDNERALEQVQRAKQFANGTDDDATIALYEGTILNDLGRKEEAAAAFRAGLLLKPNAKLPMKVSPKVQRDFEALRAVVEKELAPIQAQHDEEDRKLAEARQAEEEEARLKEEKRRADEAKMAALTAPPPVISSKKSVPAAAVPSAEVVAKPQGPKVLPWVLTGAAAVVAGTGTVLGMVSSQQYDQAKAATFQDDRVRLSGQASSTGTIANVLFGVASAAAVGAVVTFAL